ncbi:MAG TPA: SDR family NAD(P)-dependent oxidoreductase [Microthrixaceae bacterium]|nr:SDR family NAD(P)-dependent oxidoreductase [Microthrixaceae bacterium]
MGEVRFDGQSAIVTGAGNGLGREYALQLAARGAAVVCNDLDADAARATAAQIVERGGRAVPETSSVASPGAGEAIVGAALEAFGSVDVVINNAGQLRNAAFDEMTADDVDEVLRTHLGGAFHVTRPAYRHMLAAGYGRIVFTSSGAVFGSPWQANYAAAKAGVIGLCHAIALEGAPHGIRANTVMPMALTGIGATGPPPFPPELLDETVQAMRPLAPYMTVGNVAPLVLHLASRGCAVTGRTYSVGCGRVAEVVLGVTEGWVAADPARPATPEEVAQRLAAAGDGAAGDPASLEVPRSMLDEVRSVAARLPT